ncbi:MAG: hypothetical protein CL484_08755 [Acidobacteria bacterium]|nr:hypothetical protein [Acidobacteriota bacterium]|tara:strand:- start:9409 stop:9918 length:510 start_codon:yes stop_codon:yes gene_type:complete
MSRIVLEIKHTWDGKTLPPEEQAMVCYRKEDLNLVVDVNAPFHSDPPPPDPPGSLCGLWKWEVVELFIATKNETYTEIQLGPHGHFLVLTLEGERNIISKGHLIDLRVSHDRNRWVGQALIPLTLTPPLPWRVNAYAIHGSGVQRRYLAAEPVPGRQPDYHQLRHFRWV